jgi:hypothetical protein
LALWLFERFNLSLGAASAFFFWSNVLAAFSYPVAARLGKRFGLVNTMVFTHIPASICLILVAFSWNLTIAIILLLVRSALSQMDVPTRTSYVMAVVRPAERTAAASVTAVPAASSCRGRRSNHHGYVIRSQRASTESARKHDYLFIEGMRSWRHARHSLDRYCAALGAAQAQRHGPPQIAARPHGRAAAAIVAREGAAARLSVAGFAALRVPHRSNRRSNGSAMRAGAKCGRRPTGRATHTVGRWVYTDDLYEAN